MQQRADMVGVRTFAAWSATALVEMMRSTADPERVKQQGHSHHGRHAITLGVRPSTRYPDVRSTALRYCEVTEQSS
jgi:hypothetical protein